KPRMSVNQSRTNRTFWSRAVFSTKSRSVSCSTFCIITASAAAPAKQKRRERPATGPSLRHWSNGSPGAEIVAQVYHTPPPPSTTGTGSSLSSGEGGNDRRRGEQRSSLLHAVTVHPGRGAFSLTTSLSSPTRWVSNRISHLLLQVRPPGKPGGPSFSAATRKGFGGECPASPGEWPHASRPRPPRERERK